MTRRNRARAWWVRLHLWLGLSAGAVFALLGLTGSVLVFDHELDALLHPSMFDSGVQARAIDSGAAIAAAEDALDAGERVAWLSWPNDARGVFRAYGGRPDDRFGRLVTIDPATGAVLGSRAGDGGLLRFIYDLHFQLRLGGGGQTVVGIVGVLMLFSLGSGLYLWWPRKRHWRPVLTARRGTRPQRRDFDLHRVMGIHGVALLLVMCGTGIFMALPDYTEPLVSRFSPVTPPTGRIASNGPDNALDIDVDTAVAIARRQLPAARVTGVGLPGAHGGTYRVALNEPAHPRDSAGRSYIRVDRHTGDVRAARTWADMTAADRFLDWQLPLHNGEAFGLFGRLVVFATGLLPSAMLITGFLIWRHKRRAAALRRSKPINRA
jgi:uncharacterized iron-regulated membrane protein